MFRNASGTERRRPDPLVVGRLLAGLLLVYYVVPIVVLVASYPPGTAVAALADGVVAGAATTSLLAATVSAGVATAFGLPLAYWLARSESRLTGPVTAIAVLPLVLPPVVSGMVLLSVFGPQALGGPAAAAGIPLTRSLVGVVLAQTFVASPFVVVTGKAAFEGVDRRLEHASRSLGRSRGYTLRRVTLPLAWPGILAGITLAFARSIGEFGATMMMAYYPRTMPVQIWASYVSLGLEAAFPIAVLLLLIALGALGLIAIAGRLPFL